MKAVFYVLLATVLTFGSSYTLGAFLLGRLKVRMSGTERRFFTFIAGSALLSTLVFLLTAVGLARKNVFLAVTVPIIVTGVWKRVYRVHKEELPPAPRAWRAAFWIIFAIFTWVYLGNALLPETSPDGASYHVALPARYLREHHFPRIATNMYANLSQGVEMLYLYAFSIGRHSATAMVHFLFLLALPFGMIAYGRRIGRPRAGIAAALLMYLSPAVGRDGTIAYVDVAAAAVAFSLFYALQIWRADRSRGIAVVAGLLAGFGYGIKYTLFAGVVYALMTMGWWSRREWRTTWKQWSVAATCALAMMAPWLVKNVLYTSNPLAPFFNRVFPNPYMYASVERDYIEYYRHMDGVQLHEIPIEVTVRGERLTGVLGPVLLLLPLALLAARQRDGRQLLLATSVFLIPYFGNIGTRFLIPALPCATLALAITLESIPAALPAVVLVHALLSWPAMVPRWSGKYAWRLGQPDWAAALRRTPEAEYLRKARDDAALVARLDSIVPAGDLIYSPAMANNAYHSRTLVGAFESRLGSRIRDMFYRVTADNLRTTLRQHFRFGGTQLRRIRVILANRDSRPVTISEIRVWLKGAEITRAGHWRLRASVNPWDVQTAFDSSPVTVWTVGQPAEPGMYLQIDLGGFETMDEVSIDMPQRQDWAAFRIEGDSGSASWQKLADRAQREDLPWPPRMRRAVTEQMKDDGVRWIITRDGEAFTNELADRSAEWGVRQVLAENPYRLWKIE